jgi:amidase
MKFEEYRKYDALGLAELISIKQVTSAELLDTAIARAQQVNPQLNAIVLELYDLARQYLNHLPAGGAFTGVPYLIKDLGPQLKGTRYTLGSRAFQNFVSPIDTEVVTRMKKAGLNIFGKTNTPEFGLTPFTESKLLKPAHNPWSLQHTTGGSSGGSAAAVAAGIVPMASANDGGGSIRIPASCCGLFGIKLSRGAVPLGPVFGEAWFGAVSEGCVSRTVRDSAAYYDAIGGPMPGEPYVVSKPAQTYASEVANPQGKYKIGYSTKHPLGHTADEENIKAIQHTVKLLKEMGHEVEEVELPFPREVLTEMLFMLVVGETAADVQMSAAFTGNKPVRKNFESNTWMLYKFGQAYKAVDFTSARRKWNMVCRQMGAFHQKYDFLLTPTLGMRPFKIGALQNSAFEETMLNILNMLGISSLLRHTNLVEQISHKIYGWIPYTPLANLTGQPSMTVPLYRSPQNLPIGVMFTGEIGRDDKLFRMAAQLEKAQPWFNEVPQL